MQVATAVQSGMEGVVESPELTVEVAQLWPRRGQWTEADYFALPDANRFIELSEGALIMPPHPTETHQRIVGDVYVMIRRFVEGAYELLGKWGPGEEVRSEVLVGFKVAVDEVFEG